MRKSAVHDDHFFVILVPSQIISRPEWKQKYNNIRGSDSVYSILLFEDVVNMCNILLVDHE